MSTAVTLAALVGRLGSIQHAGLSIRVEVKDVQSQYGRLRYLVTPVAGEGQTWTERIMLDAPLEVAHG